MDISIGKYTLESLTSGMYLDPLALYGEYIQNAVDSLDEAIESGVLKKEDGWVSIFVDREHRQIVIEDNGVGVRSNDRSILLNIGTSEKPFTAKRGFRGIGRLVGLGYARELIFETSFMGEGAGTEILFDSEKLASMLAPGQYDSYDLLTTLRYVTDIQIRRESREAHYFRVTLNGVDESVLNRERLIDYISQVAPLPYNPAVFSYGREIADAFTRLGLALEDYKIFIRFDDADEQRQLYKLYADSLLIDKKKGLRDQISGISLQEIRDESGNPVALLWYGNSSLPGSIAANEIKGLRLRKGNMQIGDRSALNAIFKEERYNGWFQGELFVLDNLIIPNARRDNFERNGNYDTLINLLEPVGAALSALARSASAGRARLRGTNSRSKDATADLIERINQLYPQDGKTGEAQGQPAGETKYRVLNLSARLTVPEKKLAERVLDLLIEMVPEQEMLKIIGRLLSGLDLGQ